VSVTRIRKAHSAWVAMALMSLLIAAQAHAAYRTSGRAERKAERALARAQALFDPASRGKAPPADATSVLQDLSLRSDELTGRERERANALQARPTDGAADQFGDGYRLGKAGVRHTCFRLKARARRSRRICVHWAKRTRDAPPKTDANGNGRRDQVDHTIATLKAVWKREVAQLGYRAPRRDRGPRGGEGPNDGIDVYLADVGFDGLYGYCATDPRTAKQRRQRTAHAYCVLDDDFSEQQFPSPGVNGSKALHVTAAHEFFHAVQFAYDYSRRDQWLREGTAVWMEDEVYDGINAGYDFLDESPLSQPDIPLDEFGAPDTGERPEYGAWIFWRFLSEYFRSPGVIRKVWGQVANGRRALDATSAVVEGRRPSYCLIRCGAVTFADVLAEFHAWNLLTSQPAYWDYWFGPTQWRTLFAPTYEEEAGYADAIGPVPSDAEFFLDGQHPTTGRRALSVDHLSERMVAIVLPEASRVRIDLDLPPKDRGSAASVVWVDGNGVNGQPISLDSTGSGSIDLPESTTPSPEFIVLLLHNTSASHDGEPYAYTARIVP
jgi:hypothetical protein